MGVCMILEVGGELHFIGYCTYVLSTFYTINSSILVVFVGYDIMKNTTINEEGMIEIISSSMPCCPTAIEFDI